jgi:hypothetical protein
MDVGQEDVVIFATHKTMAYRVRELRDEAARVRIKAPKSARGRMPAAQPVLFGGRWTDLRQLAVDTRRL